ncbi:MAG: hypothetical protein CMO16_04380 [Thaumarchaeota archaeon]|nr:hypothetical protein [Nitrososphaerota archaeon]|tara:strand:- start:1090 stop:1314 length:225 start_codon:yes stop_codon:yes gene_type:complete
MSEDRSAIYKIRWEILIMAVALVLSALVVLAIPSDFSQRLVEQRTEEESKNKTAELEEQVDFNESESTRVVTKP